MPVRNRKCLACCRLWSVLILFRREDSYAKGAGRRTQGEDGASTHVPAAERLREGKRQAAGTVDQTGLRRKSGCLTDPPAKGSRKAEWFTRRVLSKNVGLPGFRGNGGVFPDDLGAVVMGRRIFAVRGAAHHRRRGLHLMELSLGGTVSSSVSVSSRSFTTLLASGGWRTAAHPGSAHVSS